MSYSPDKPFKDREHILWEIAYCNKASTSVIILSLVCLLLGIISNVLDMKLALDSASWFMVSIVAGVLSLPPELHVLLARHLLGTEVISKEKKEQLRDLSHTPSYYIFYAYILSQNYILQTENIARATCSIMFGVLGMILMWRKGKTAEAISILNTALLVIVVLLLVFPPRLFT